jgi:hypothetical protein
LTKNLPSSAGSRFRLNKPKIDFSFEEEDEKDDEPVAKRTRFAKDKKKALAEKKISGGLGAGGGEHGDQHQQNLALRNMTFTQGEDMGEFEGHHNMMDGYGSDPTNSTHHPSSSDSGNNAQAGAKRSSGNSTLNPNRFKITN